ncbi:protein arginine N-methyltransferase 6-like isoform X2 [Antedon mediterranea]
MISDSVRTNTYRLALLKNCDRLIGKVVADIGAGTGILSCFCVQAGARKVYAIEASSIAKRCEEVIKSNKMENKIQVINQRVEDVHLPEKVDVIVSEWMGYFLLYESMLNSVIYARDKFLKKNGLILPSIASIYMAPITDAERLDEVTSLWKTMQKLYGVDMSCLAPHAHKLFTRNIHVEEFPPKNMIGFAEKIIDLDLNRITVKDLECVKGQFSFKAMGESELTGFVAWFDVHFDCGDSGLIELSTSPSKHPTHWRQCILYLNKSENVEQDTTIEGTITLAPSQIMSRFLDVEIFCKVGNRDGSVYKFAMDDNPT